MRIAKLTVWIVTSAASALAGLNPATTQAFEHYDALTEARIRQEVSSGPFLSIDCLPAKDRVVARVRLAAGEVLIQRLRTDDHGQAIEVPGGLIHHWTATAFIPGATLDRALAVLQDYDDQQRLYSPDVQQSRLISRRGDDFHIFLRFRRTKVVSVVLDTEHDVHYARVDAMRGYSRSVSTRIAEVADVGKPLEHELSPGEDHGFLWRLNSYWRFEQAEGGLYLECEAVSLTRDIPTGLGWLIRPFVESVPRESLFFTMSATRKALDEKNLKASHEGHGGNTQGFDADSSWPFAQPASLVFRFSRNWRENKWQQPKSQSLRSGGLAASSTLCGFRKVSRRRWNAVFCAGLPSACRPGSTPTT